MSSVIRAAAYIRYREDAKRRRGRLKCKPPNRVCGSRCIPPNWDCRLKGEGEDPHLKAAGKGIDVTAGAANIERGIKRVGKGLVKLSPSEIEGGRRAIARGAKNLAPGNIADKQKVEKRVYRLIGAVGAPLTVGVLGILAHNALKGADDRSGGGFPYRTVLGNKIDNSASAAVANIRRNMPLGFGQRYRATEAAYGRAMEQTGRVMRGVSGVPEVPLANTPGTNYLRKRSREGTVFAKAVLRNQDSLERSGRSYSKMDYDKWVKDSRFNFWTTPRSLEGGGNLPGVNAGGSVFSVPAANDLLAKSFGIANTKATNTMEAHQGMIRKIAAELDSTAEIVHQSMRQRGLDPSKPNDVRNFLRVNNPRSTGNPEIDTRTRGFVEELVVTHKKGGASSRIAARKLYNETVAGFDVYFRSIAEQTNVPPGLNRQAQQSSFYTQASRAHAAFLGKAEGVARPVVGPGTEAAALRIYHARKVMGLKTAQITDVEMFNALSELFPRREIPRIPDQQLEMLNEAYRGTKGFTAFQRAQRPSYGPYGRKRRGDEASSNELQVSAKLEVRRDKKCGKSGIAEGKKCHKQSAGGAVTPAKPTGGAVAEAPKPPPPVAGRAAKLAKIAAVAGIAAAGAAGAASAVSNRQESAVYRSSPEQLNKLINKLSQENVTAAINKLPKELQEPANNLLGKAKLGLAAVAADAQGMKIQSVDKKNNFSTWKHPAGHVMSIGSVGDTLVSFVSQRTGDVGGFPNYGMAFQTDLKFDQKSGVSRSNGVKVARTAEAMFQDQLKQLPDSTFIHAKAHADDGLGKKRASIYTKKGFRELPGVRGGDLYALKNEGKFTKIPDEQVERIAEMFRGKRSDAYEKTYQATRERLDKKCGKSAISEHEKCTKRTVASPVEPAGRSLAYRVRQGASIGLRTAAIAGGATLAAKAASEGEVYPAVGFALVSMLAVKSLHRERMVTKSTKDIVKDMEDLKQHPDTNHKAIEKFQKFVTETELDAQRVNTPLVSLGLSGMFSPLRPNRIFLSNPKTDLPDPVKGDPVTSLVGGVKQYMDRRQELKENLPDIANMTPRDLQTQISKNFWSPAKHVGNSRGLTTYYTLHEGAHALHYRSGFKTPSKVTVNGKTYEGDELEAALHGSASIYGASDLKRTAGKAKNYYQTGNRLEVFAEHFPLYITNPKQFKAQHPVSYAWTEATAEYAFSQPAKKARMKSAKEFKELMEKGDNRLKARRDAETNPIKEIHEAAMRGDLAAALKILIAAPANIRPQLAMLLETAAMYAVIDGNN